MEPTLGIAAIAVLAVSTLPLPEAQSQYPVKPMVIIVAFAAGGDSDISARNLAQHAPKYLNNQPLVVLNRVGASGLMGPSTRPDIFGIVGKQL